MDESEREDDDDDAEEEEEEEENIDDADGPWNCAGEKEEDTRNGGSALRLSSVAGP